MQRMTKKEALEVLALLKKAHPHARRELDAETPFQLLIATILSAQTTDKQVNKVTPALFAAYPSPAILGKASAAEVEELIRSIGFFRTKAKHIVQTAAILDGEYGGQVPQDLDRLTKLPGVGRKTANVVLSNAFGKPAIAVDTHVFRVSNRLGLSKSKDVKKCEEDLQKILPREEWSQAHHLLIFQGRYVCRAQSPKCQDCLLTDHCRFLEAQKKKAAQEEKLAKAGEEA